jgi:hypothetical protein
MRPGRVEKVDNEYRSNGIFLFTEPRKALLSAPFLTLIETKLKSFSPRPLAKQGAFWYLFG